MCYITHLFFLPQPFSAKTLFPKNNVSLNRNGTEYFTSSSTRILRKNAPDCQQIQRFPQQRPRFVQHQLGFVQQLLQDVQQGEAFVRQQFQINRFLQEPCQHYMVIPLEFLVLLIIPNRF